MRFLRVLAVLICALVVAGNSWHIAKNNASPSWDDAWYLETSFKLYHAANEGVASFIGVYTEAFRTKAPLLSVLPLPLYLALGPGERLALGVNQAALVLLWLAIFLLGRELHDEKAGLIGVAACALIPMIYGLSRIFMVECVLAALVAWTHYMILRMRRPSAKIAGGLGLLLGIGLLTKSLFPLYILGPAWLKRRWLSPHAKRIFLIGAITAGTWYVFNLPYVVGFGLSAGFGRIAQDYRSSLPSFAAGLGRDGFSWPYLAGAALILALARLKRPQPGGGELKFLASWFIVPVVPLLLSVNKDIRYLAPALPAAALFVSIAAARLLAHPWGPTACAAWAAAGVAVFSSQTFGRPAAAPLAYNGPPRSQDVPWSRESVLNLLKKRARPHSMVGVGLEHPQLNANNLASLAAARDLPWRFTIAAHGSAEDVLIRLKDKSASYLITVEGADTGGLPPGLNRAAPEVRRFLETGRIPAEPIGTAAVAEGVTATLWRLGDSGSNR